MEIRKNISLKPYNTFGLEVKAARFARITSVGELQQLIRSGEPERGRSMVLGGGSNVLFTADYDGLVVMNAVAGIEVKESGYTVTVTAGSGVVWDELVHFCVERGYGGIENLSLIPGSTGAGPIQNIGAYGVELKDVFRTLLAVDLETGSLEEFDASSCHFGYRDSIFKNELKGRYVIVSVSLSLSKQHMPDTSYGAINEELHRMGLTGKPGIADVRRAVIAIRRSKLPDPETIGNAGSFFKNPVIPRALLGQIQAENPDVPFYVADTDLVKVPAAWLIDRCGWKGKTHGNAAVHDRQPLVLVNRGGANGKEILELAELVRASVMERFGIMLEMEVNVL
jgi:UDP-N-acetylmuramate dehydrogenase